MNIVKIQEGREALARLCKGVGVEVGVERGHFSKELLLHCDYLYAVDPWMYDTEYRNHVDQTRLDSFYEETKNRLAGLNCRIIRDYSVSAAQQFKNEELSFVYIDARHEYKYVLEDIMWWAEKVKKGGIVSGHDYVTRKDFGVIEAVNAYCVRNKIEELTLFVGDRSPSWMFKKQ